MNEYQSKTIDILRKEEDTDIYDIIKNMMVINDNNNNQKPYISSPLFIRRNNGGGIYRCKCNGPIRYLCGHDKGNDSLIDQFKHHQYTLKPSLYNPNKNPIWYSSSSSNHIKPNSHDDETYKWFKIRNNNDDKSPRGVSKQSSTIEETKDKKKLCYYWLRGCYMGDKCEYAHRLEELFRPFFYKQDVLEYYSKQQKQGVFNEKKIWHNIKDIIQSKCTNPNCTYYDKSDMSSKTVYICGKTDDIKSESSQQQLQELPYFIIQCTTCKYEKKYSVY